MAAISNYHISQYQTYPNHTTFKNQRMHFSVLVCTIFLVLANSLNSIFGKVLWNPEHEGFDYREIFSSLRPSSENETEISGNSIRFFLWTHNSYKREEIFENVGSIGASHWDADAPVKVVIHGYMRSSTGGESGEIKDGYIEDGYPTNVNVLLVDWGDIALTPVYPIAAAETERVGHTTAQLLSFLVQNKYTTPSKIHIIGHSLGAHTAGYAGAKFNSLHGVRVARITGLDPAGPLFEFAGPSGRIDPTDATFVDIMHTAAGPLITGGMGLNKPLGHYDVYPNKGDYQPGCGCGIEPVQICSHLRAACYFRESINSRRFVSCKCDDDDYQGLFPFNDCSCRKGEAVMGEWTPTSARGIHHLKTNKRKPYARG